MPPVPPDIRRIHPWNIRTFDFIRQHSTLYGSTYGYYFIRVNALRRSFTEEFLNDSLYSRDTSRTTYQDHFVDIRS